MSNEMQAKTVFPETIGTVGLMVANGEAEIGIVGFQGLMAVAGIELVGPLPGDLQDTIIFWAAIMASSNDTEASKSLINFLRTPEAAAVISAKGMEPATP